MKVTVLIENTALREGLTAEHGLSLYIETNDRTILFDAGQTGAFADNAEKLGVDLQKVDLCILSHGHHDHGGGLKRFLEINDHAPVYLSRHAFGNYFSGDHYIGLDPTLEGNPRLICSVFLTEKWLGCITGRSFDLPVFAFRRLFASLVSLRLYLWQPQFCFGPP